MIKETRLKEIFADYKTAEINQRLSSNLGAKANYLLAYAPDKRVRDFYKNNTLNVTAQIAKLEDLNAYTKNASKDVFITAPFILMDGLLAHELGHVLYTWFPGSEYFIELMEKKAIPKEALAIEDEALRIKANKLFKAKPYLVMPASKLWSNFNNIIEDGFLERKFIRTYRGGLAIGLKILRKLQLDKADDLEDILNVIDNKRLLMPILNLTLIYAKYGVVKREDDKALDSELFKKFRPITPGLRKVVNIENKKARFKYTTKLFLEYYLPLLDAEIEDKEDSNNLEQKLNDFDKHQNSGQASPFENEDIDINTSNSSGENSKAKNDNTGNKEKSKQEEQDKERTFTEESIEGEFVEDTIDADELENINREIEKRKTTEENLKITIAKKAKTDKSLQKKINQKEMLLNIQSENIHKDVDAEIIDRERDVKTYYKILNNIQKQADELFRIINQFEQSFTDQYTKYGQFYGGRFSAKYLYRPDVGNFKVEMPAQDIPQLAIMILIDESGSMAGRRIEAAQATAILIENACRRLELPIAIYGHTDTGAFDGQVILNRYLDFDDTEAEKAATLGSIESGYANRDGYALRYALDLIKTEQSDKDYRLLFIINDGLPSAFGYGGGLAVEDIQDALKEHPETKVFALAIGDDIERIGEIYGENNTIDCSDLKTLPKAIASTIEDYIKGIKV